jgi:hypothetical protein
MAAPSQRLWWLNYEYRTRLARAEHCLSLLENLVVSRGAAYDEHGIALVLQGLYRLRQQLAHLHDEHRDWRYRYYYQSPQHKRMVADDESVYRALLHFRRMRDRHERALWDALDGLATLPRPISALTHVPSGDLWQTAEHALSDLAHFMVMAAEQEG